ncbi:MAG: asparagine synthase-related protein [Trueperaceae bacterium]
MLRALESRAPDGSDSLTLGPLTIGCARLDTLPEDGHQPVTVRNVTVAADARLDNRPDLEASLGMNNEASEAELVAAAIAKWGDTAPSKLEGDFAVIAWDGERVLAFRDRFGVRPLFFAESNGLFAMASEIGALTAHPRVGAHLDRDYFLLQLAALVPPTTLTPYRSVKRLMPGESVVAEPGKPARFWRYYELPVRYQRMETAEAAERTRALLDQAVQAALRGRGQIGCDVSGGMDSTSIYATALSLGTVPLALSIVSDAWPTVDEREFSRPLVGSRPWKRVYAEHHEPGGADSGLCLPTMFDEPTQDVLFGVRVGLYQSLPAGCRIVLSGHGSDGTMTGGVGAARQLLQEGRFLSAYRELRMWGDAREKPFWSVAKSTLLPGRIPVARLPWASAKVARKARAMEHALSTSVARQADGNLDAVNFLRSTEPGLRQQPRLAVEFRYPFLYRPLVEHALATPAALKAGGGIGKRVLREAMSGRLPQAILERKLKTGFTEAYAFGIRANWPNVSAWLREPILAELNVLEAQRMRELAEAFRDGRLSRDAEIVYILADERWFFSRFVKDDPTNLPSRRSATGVRR